MYEGEVASNGMMCITRFMKIHQLARKASGKQINGHMHQEIAFLTQQNKESKLKLQSQQSVFQLTFIQSSCTVQAKTKRTYLVPEFTYCIWFYMHSRYLEWQMKNEYGYFYRSNK
jgi:hypothetical protein